ncbi:hypothetical protein C4K38_0655 [Pseudomonas chlororaphis subsp. piscium]|nr:hypothetical protein C4K38_0655 [Pseudomonas chlororaphis subsp. piscium]
MGNCLCSRCRRLRSNATIDIVKIPRIFSQPVGSGSISCCV